VSDEEICRLIEEHPMCFDYTAMPERLRSGKVNEYKVYARDIGVDRLQARYVSVAEAEEELGLRPNTLTHWCRDGRLRAEKFVGRGNQWFIVRTELDRVWEELADYCTTEAVAEAAGMDRAKVARLCRLGYLHGLRRGRSWFIPIAEVKALLASLDHVWAMRGPHKHCRACGVPYHGEGRNLPCALKQRAAARVPEVLAQAS
jgi:hypothetical protein